LAWAAAVAPQMQTNVTESAIVLRIAIPL